MTPIVPRAALLLAGLALAPAAAAEHAFQLHGGFFYGPGPIEPDTPLPDGSIRGIRFDLDRLEGVAEYVPSEDTLSDGKTRTNANIDAGELTIGGDGENKAFWLVAVADGPNEGRETYRFDDAYNMVWTVDLALDPGFPEGIVRVNGFELTTGRRTVPESLQTERGMPGGYDKAGSLPSGTVLVGRVGDFDADGFLDGTIVATAHVPLQADLLPGAPVGNVRGFRSDIAVDPLFALELTLHGIVGMRPLVEEALTGDRIDELTQRLTDIHERLLAARANYEAAYVGITADKRATLQELGWRLESIRQMVYIPLAFLTTYDYPTGNASASIVDATTRAFDKAAALAEMLETRRTGGEH
jgi:hypothetical protein